jgi:hypothetical protein
MFPRIGRGRRGGLPGGAGSGMMTPNRHQIERIAPGMLA